MIYAYVNWDMHWKISSVKRRPIYPRLDVIREYHECELNIRELVFAHHDDVIKWKHFRVAGPLCGDTTGHRWIPLIKPVTRSFDVFSDLCLNWRLSKQSWRRLFKTRSRSLWRHCKASFVFHLEWPLRFVSLNSTVVVVRWMGPLSGYLMALLLCVD